MKLPKEKGLLWYGLAQAAILLVFYFPWLTNASAYFFRDLTHYIEPFGRFTGESMRHLNFPLWNPWCYCGMSQVAITLQSICYPPTWLFALLTFSSGLAAIMVLHQLVLGLGGYLLVRSFGWSRWAATTAAITMSLSGYCFCFTSIFSLVQSAAWCPFVLWSVIELGKIAGDDRKQIAIGTAVTACLFAMQILAGYPDLTAFELGIVLSYVACSGYTGWRAGNSTWPSILIVRIRAIMLGFFLAMPLILPAFEWLEISRRSAGLDPTEALVLSGSWYDLLGLILPQPLGDMQLRWSEFRPLIMAGQLLPYMASAFVGPAAVSMAFWGFSDREWKQRYVVLALLLFFMVLALGVNTPVVPAILAMSKIPIRFPVKLMFFVVCCLAIAAARGLEACLEKRAGIYLTASVFWIACAAFALLLFGGTHPLDALLQFQNMPPELQALLRKAELPLAWSLLFTSAGGLLFSLCGTLFNKGKFLFCFPQLMIAAALASMLVYAATYCHHLGPAGYFTDNCLAHDLIKKAKPPASGHEGTRIVGLYLEHFTVPPELLDKDNLKATIQMYQYSRQVLRSNTNIDFSVPSSVGFEGSCTGDYFFFFHNCYGKSSQAYQGPAAGVRSDDALARFCQMTATRFALTQIYRFGENPQSMVAVPPLDSRFFHLKFEVPALNLRVYEVPECLPRAYFADHWQTGLSHEEVLNKIFQAEKNTFDPNKVTLLESPSQAGDADRSGVAEQTHDNKVSIESDDGNSVTVAVDAKRHGFMILADQYYPGWVAQLDGKDAKIIPANGFMKAVEVPKGQHQVRFRYQPLGFFVGLLLSLIAFAWLLLLRFYPHKAAKVASPADAKDDTMPA